MKFTAYTAITVIAYMLTSVEFNKIIAFEPLLAFLELYSSQILIGLSLVHTVAVMLIVFHKSKRLTTAGEVTFLVSSLAIVLSGQVIFVLVNVALIALSRLVFKRNPKKRAHVNARSKTVKSLAISGHIN